MGVEPPLANKQKNMQNNKYTKLISLSLGVMIFSFIIGTALFAWREPAQTPPAGNVPAPINIGTIEQHKAGEIGAHRFEDSQNTSWFIDPNQPISAAFSGNVGIGQLRHGEDYIYVLLLVALGLY